MVLMVFIFLGTRIFKVIHTLEEVPFSPQSWKLKHEERIFMSDDLANKLKNKRKSTRSVQKLLGKPDMIVRCKGSFGFKKLKVELPDDNFRAEAFSPSILNDANIHVVYIYYVSKSEEFLIFFDKEDKLYGLDWFPRRDSGKL